MLDSVRVGITSSKEESISTDDSNSGSVKTDTSESWFNDYAYNESSHSIIGTSGTTEYGDDQESGNGPEDNEATSSETIESQSDSSTKITVGSSVSFNEEISETSTTGTVK